MDDQATLDSFQKWINKLNLNLEPIQVTELLKEFYSEIKASDKEFTFVEGLVKDKQYQDVYFLITALMCNNLETPKVLTVLEGVSFLMWLTKKSHLKLI